MRILKKILLTLSLGLFLFAPSAQSQPIPDINLDVPNVHQDTEVWCWVATAQMNIKYRNGGNSPTQCRMLELGYGLPAGYCCGHESNCMRGGYIPEIQNLVAMLGGTVSSIAPPTDPMTLYGSLARDQPVVAQVRVQGGASTHFVVIRGMIFRPLSVFVPGVGPTVQMMPFVIVNDPLGLVTRPVPYPEFLSWWMAAIVIGPNISPTAPTENPSSPPTPTTKPSGTPTGTAGEAEDSDERVCTVFKRIARSAPNFDRVNEEPEKVQKETGLTFYDAEALPGLTRCRISKAAGEDGAILYSCKISKQYSNDCEEVVRGAKAYAQRVQGCVPGMYVTTKTSLEDKPYHFTANYDIEGRAGPTLWITVEALETEEGRKCGSKLTFFGQ